MPTTFLQKIITLTAALAFTSLPVFSQSTPTWDWQLSEPLDLTRQTDIIDTDPDTAKTSDIGRYERNGTMTICYVSVGTLENYRSDAAMFPASVIGNTYGDWPDEKFLDIRQLSAIIPLMEKRFRICKAMGFDAIEPDNLDVHENDSGFTISANDVVVYVHELARLAHSMGLQIGQKNVPDLTPQLVQTMDFAITESCYQDNWCQDMSAYLDMGKLVLDAEYIDRPINWTKACSYAAQSGIAMILKDRDLTKFLRTCE